MDYTIRPATAADVSGITEVAYHTWNVTYAQSVAAHNRQEFLDQAYTPEALAEAIRDELGWFYVAVRGKTVVGFAQYRRRFDGQGELVRIYVHLHHQRRGIGHAFLATGLTAMRAAGISRCYVSAEANNTTACAFYERHGFRPHRKYAHFLGDQIVQLVEYSASIKSLLDTSYAKLPTAKSTERN
jgi:ribosomal protein S18 acetylase RimI-like enzyme